LHVNEVSDFSASGIARLQHRRRFEETMMTIKSALIGATAIAIALTTSSDLRPAVAASQGGPAIVKQKAGADEIGAARKRRGYRGNPAVPLAAFGALAGTIATVAAANRRREYYDGYYHAPRYYEEPAYGYYGGPAYGPPAHYYARPAYPQHDYYSRWGGSGGQPGYRGPNVNVPGPTNYGQAAGQNGQQGPASVNAQQAGGSN
jgi:hypothetical protein